MSNNIKLSICIATYNRAKFIGETLDSIVHQLNNFIEIIIVDGASTDNTSDILLPYISTYKNIRYFRLDKKGGVDQDYDKAVSFASGDMCWLFTDDDLIENNAIELILAEINKEVSLIVVNATVKNHNLSKVITNRILITDSNIVLNENDNNNLFKNIVPYVSFIGCVIIKRNLWLERSKEIYYGSEFVHVGVIFQKQLPKKAIILSQPLITIRLGNEQWTSRSFEIWLFKWPMLLNSFDLINNDLKSPYSLKPSFRRFRNVIIQRSKGAYVLNDYYKWFKNSILPFPWKVLMYIISITPIFLCKFLISSFLFFKINK
jgi:glycosyltransferase involved in cell wall biosynthesis